MRVRTRARCLRCPAEGVLEQGVDPWLPWLRSSRTTFEQCWETGAAVQGKPLPPAALPGQRPQRPRNRPTCATIRRKVGMRSTAATSPASPLSCCLADGATAAAGSWKHASSGACRGTAGLGVAGCCGRLLLLLLSCTAAPAARLPLRCRKGALSSSSSASEVSTLAGSSAAAEWRAAAAALLPATGDSRCRCSSAKAGRRRGSSVSTKLASPAAALTAARDRKAARQPSMPSGRTEPAGREAAGLLVGDWREQSQPFNAHPSVSTTPALPKLVANSAPSMPPSALVR